MEDLISFFCYFFPELVMDTDLNMDSSGASDTTVLKRNSKDVAWEYGMLINPRNVDKVKCKLCGKEFSGGAYRIKEHIANIPGNVSACPKSSEDDQKKCKNAIEEAKKKKKNKSLLDSELRRSVKIHESEELEDEIEIEEMRSKKIPRTLGPIDRFAAAIDPESRPLLTRQQNISDAIWKEKTHKVQTYMARWVYAAGLPFSVTESDEFKMMVEAIGQFGPGVTPPSQYQLRERLLKEEVERIDGLLKPREEEWKKHGCTVMTDAWTDRKRRSIMNLCINSKGGTMFRSSKDCSSEAHTGEYIFEYVKGCIEFIGEENVVQVLTDNATNNMAASKMLKQIKPSIFWTSCATHSINLLLESIARLPKFKETIQAAKKFTIFIYAHHKTLALMRSFTGKRDIVRPGVTRFASSFLTCKVSWRKETS